MNQTVSLAADLAKNPTAELSDLLKSGSMSESARQAVAEVAGSSPSNKAGDGRLQVVDENQNFTWVSVLDPGLTTVLIWQST
jgi:hypothetical protein